jgi:phage tail sheath gpL-like
MTAAIIIPGLTADDKVPGAYTSLSYGVGRRNVGDAPVKLTVVGSMAQAQEAELSAVTKSGAGPTVTASGTPLVDGEYVATITTGGINGTSQFSLTKDGVSVASAVPVPTTPFTYLIPGGSGVTMTFPNGTYVLNETYALQGYAAKSAGTANLNQIYPIASLEDAAALFLPGTELYGMCESALGFDGVTLFAIATAWAVGANAASLTVTVGGTWVTGGSTGIRLGGTTYMATSNADDSPATVAERLADQINDDDDSFWTADADGADVILTDKTPGARGNLWSAWRVLSQAPAGLTLTLTGGATLTGGGVYFSGGTGADNVEDVLEVLLPENASLYNFYAFAQNDSANMNLIEEQLDLKSGPLVQKYEQACYGFTGSQAAAQALTQVTMNHVFTSLALYEQGEAHPSQVAAKFGALRARTEGSNPNPNYNGAPLPGLAPRAAEAMAAEPIHSKLKAQLNSGITPLVTKNGVVQIVRAITSKCLTGATPDYSTLDLGQATVPMRCARELDAEWDAYIQSNPYAGPAPDAQGGEKAQPAGVATPDVWNAKQARLLSDWEAKGWIYKVAQFPPEAYWDDEAERIMSAVHLNVRPLNSQRGTNVRQVA